MRRRPAPMLVPLALLALAVACGGDDATSESTSPDASPALPTLEPITTFGCAECEGPELLARPGVTVGASGRVYVFDTTEPHVRVLEPDGALGPTFGRSGEGPGEIRLPLLLGVLEDDNGGAWLQEAAFLHHFAADGTFVESRPIVPRVPIGWDYDRERQLIYVVAVSIRGMDPADAPRRALLRLTTEGGEPETVAPWAQLTGEEPAQGPDADSRWSTVAVAPDGRIAIVDVLNYRVRVLSASGELLGEFGRSEMPRPRKPDWRIEREQKIAAEQGNPPPDPIGFHLAGMAAFDGAGRLWLPTQRREGLIDVFSAAGELLGEVFVGARIVEGAMGLDIAGDRMAAILFDENELPTVHVFRIVDR